MSHAAHRTHPAQMMRVAHSSHSAASRAHAAHDKKTAAIYISIIAVFGVIIIGLFIAMIALIVRTPRKETNTETFFVAASSLSPSASNSVSRNEILAFGKLNGWSLATLNQISDDGNAGSQVCAYGYAATNDAQVAFASPTIGARATASDVPLKDVCTFPGPESIALPPQIVDATIYPIGQDSVSGAITGVVFFGIKPSSPEEAASRGMTILPFSYVTNKWSRYTPT